MLLILFKMICFSAKRLGTETCISKEDDGKNGGYTGNCFADLIVSVITVHRKKCHVQNYMYTESNSFSVCVGVCSMQNVWLNPIHVQKKIKPKNKLLKGAFEAKSNDLWKREPEEFISMQSRENRNKEIRRTVLTAPSSPPLVLDTLLSMNILSRFNYLFQVLPIKIPDIFFNKLRGKTTKCIGAGGRLDTAIMKHHENLYPSFFV